MKRRQLLKAGGATVGAGLLGGAGLIATTGSVSAQSGLHITASDPADVSNDRGDLTRVTIDPSFRVEWENFDTAVGKIMVLVEARTREDGFAQGAGWTPVFRMTPWLTEDVAQNGGGAVDYSKPGTSGHYEITSKLSWVMKNSIEHRVDGISDFPRRPLEVVNEVGRPDFDAISYPGGVTKQSFLEGNSIGSAGAYSDVGSLVNNFPGTDAGYYGAAIDTSNFDVPEDGAQDLDTVELRYTVAFYTPTFADSTEVGSGWYENVRESDLQEANGHSKLVMNDEDDYPDVRDQNASHIDSEATNHYPSLQRMADSHPAVMVATTDFDVTVVNEESTVTGDSIGDSNTGASGSGQ